MNHAHYQRIPSKHLGREVHVWQHGWFGQPVLVFPSAAGMAHEWQASSAVAMLQPWINAGIIKLYCPESNVSEAWTSEADPAWRLQRHEAYERFVGEEFLPYVRSDCRSESIKIFAVGCSFGSFYAANLALKRPEEVPWALCLSGRYRTSTFLDGHDSAAAVQADPLRYVPHLADSAVQNLRNNTKLTLVVGKGPFENRCIPETAALARTLASRGIPHEHDVWGHDAAHDWVWWKRQIRYHFGRHIPGFA